MRREGQLGVTVKVEVAFHDIDLAGIAWHGHYLKYLENARWALFERIGYSLEDMVAASEGWPIVDIQVRYIRAARFHDRLVVRASLAEWQSRLVINYLVTDEVSGERVTRARTVQVAVGMPDGELRFELPLRFVALVDAAIRAGADGAPE